MVKLLVYHDADIYAMNDLYESPYTIAQTLDDPTILNFFDLHESIPEIKEVDELKIF